MNKLWLVLILLVAFLFTGCASWRANTTNTFTGIRLPFITAVDTVKPSCQQEVISKETCIKLKDRAATCVKAYKAASSDLKMAFTIDDAIKKDELMQQFDIILDSFKVATLDMIELIQDILAMQTKTQVPHGIKKLDPTIVSIIIAAIEAMVKIAPTVAEWIGNLASSETEIPVLISQIDASVAEVEATMLDWE